MGLILLFLGVIVVIVLVLVFLSQVQPRMTGRSEGEAEQDITGMGPESPRVGPDDRISG